METYQDFLDRINSFEHKIWSFAPGHFQGNPSLEKKVKQDNLFRPYYGDTAVFHLDLAAKTVLAQWLDKLYAAVPECFSERLVTDTFHMTLHDLSNSDDFSEIVEDVAWNKEKIQDLCNEIPDFHTIKMRSKCMFNMVNTSLVLGLYPANEAEYCKLMNLYEAFNKVRELPYPLTPHITLAYYNVNGFCEASARKLEELVCRLNCEELKHEMEIVLKAKNLYYQYFDSMNHYTNVLGIFRQEE